MRAEAHPQAFGTPASPSLSASDVMSIGNAGVEAFEHWHRILRNGLTALPDKPDETPEAALRALWFRAADIPLSTQGACERPLVLLATAQQKQLADLIGKRLAGVPLAHICERQRFMGVELLAGPQALIPRRETELLGEAVVGLLTAAAGGHRDALVLDICTGSGNLAIGIAMRVPGTRVLGADLAPEAVDLARGNVARLALQARIEMRQGDLLAPFESPEFLGRVDVLVCNPPYISSGKLATMPGEIAGFEPAMAFDGGPFGIRILHRLIREAPRFLRPGGWLAFEVGLGQGPAVIKRIAAAAGFGDVRPQFNDGGEIRAVLAQMRTSD